MFKHLKNDLETFQGNWAAQGFWVMVVYRFGRWRFKVKPTILRKACSLIYKFFYKLVQIMTGIELPCEVEVGDGFVIDHFGGIIISGFATFGHRCRIRNGVVVGLKNLSNPIAPRFGDDVDIGAGAKVLGDITIGHRVSIGANAVVLCDVPDDSIAVGVPAIIKPKSKSFVATTVL